MVVAPASLTPASGAPTVPVRTVLAPLRTGAGDPTTRLSPIDLVRATLTPHGPGTVQIAFGSGTVVARAWGPGADWLLAAVPGMVGELDEPVRFEHAHPAILRAQRNLPGLRLGRSGDLYHELLPVVLGQRITGGEAARQWWLLCRRLGRPAPGPFHGLLLPPEPARLAEMPSWWFHPLGIERKRAAALVEVATHASKLWAWVELGAAEAAAKLALMRGVGEWTIGCVLRSALGEPDAVAVGDYHLKNMVAFALAGEARATDERMLELLDPYRGQRGRVTRLLELDGPAAPKFGPRQRVLPMARW
jgi:3-methyladenine DNA glycosylase/8-oxoguanine DNA glycosylase